ncbi:MAG: ComEC/Rec2 family competence protein [Clostridiales bacterium]|nr:ComEC/Rec2 family competence protein [Clostridiales bacterium]
MQFLEKYPTVAMFFAFFLSSCLLAYGIFPVRMGILTAVLLLLTAVVLRRSLFGNARRGVILMLAATLAAGIWSVGWNDFWAAKIETAAGTTEYAALRITDCDYTAVYGSRYRAEILSSGCLPKHTGVFLETSQSGLANGSIVEGEITYSSLSSLGSGTFDAVRYYRSDRIFLLAEGEPAVTGFRRVVSVRAFFRAISERLTAFLVAHAGRDAGGLGAALTLGNRDHVQDALTRDFRRIGISHLLVVSGTHFSILISLLTALFRRLPIHRRKRAAITIAVIVFFIFLTGGTPSVVRAGIMHLLVQLGILFTRRANSLNSFAISGAVLILINPFAAADCGLQLSFAATYACLLYAADRNNLFRKCTRGLRKSRLRFLFKPLELIVLTAWVSFVTLPLIWLYFGELPLLSIPANLLFVPLVTVYMYLTLAMLILSPLVVLTPLFARLLGVGYAALTSLAGSCSRLGSVVLPVNYSFALFFLVPAAVLLLAFPFFRERGKKIALLTGCSLTAVFLMTVGCVRLAARDDVAFTYLNRGIRDSFVVLSENRVLFGDMSDGASGSIPLLTAEMSRLHASEVDAVVLTHYHKKHVQYLGRLAERQIVRALVLPEPQNDDEREVCASLEETAGEYGIDVIRIPAGEAYDFRGIGITVFPRTLLSRSTHPVSGAEIDLPGCTAVLASSSFNQGDPALIEAVNTADVLILGPHSPVYKKSFRLDFDDPPEVMAFCADALSYMEEVPEGYVPIAGQPIRVTGRRG